MPPYAAQAPSSVQYIYMTNLFTLLAKIKTSIKRPKVVIGIVVVTLLITGGLLFAFTKETTTPTRVETLTHSTDTPDESKENAATHDWRGNPGDPKKIRIPDINVDTFVQRAGVDQHNRVAVPNNVHLASWFTDSQQPGQKGLSIISAHVTGRTTDGVFKQLGKLQEGNTFEVELGNGEIKRYKVIGKVQVKETEAANHLFSQNPKVNSQINLITCGGDFDKASNQYEERVIVSGALIN